jgi:hypothetical protein
MRRKLGAFSAVAISPVRSLPLQLDTRKEVGSDCEQDHRKCAEHNRVGDEAEGEVAA